MSVSSIGMNGGGFPLRVMSGASARYSPAQKMSDVFQKIDTTGSNSITSTQFAQSFPTLNPPQAFKSIGADSIFNQLSNGKDSISKQDFVDGMKKLMEQVRNQAATNNAPNGTFASSLEAMKALGSSGFHTVV